MVGHLHHPQNSVTCCCKRRAPQCCCHSNIPTACINSVVLKKKKSPCTIKRDAARKKAFMDKKFPVMSVTDQSEQVSQLKEQLKKSQVEIEMLRKKETNRMETHNEDIQNQKKELSDQEKLIKALEEGKAGYKEEHRKVLEELEFHRMNSASVSCLQEQMEQEKNTHESLIKTTNDKINMYRRQLSEKDIKILNVTSDFQSLKTKERMLMSTIEETKVEHEEFSSLYDAVRDFDVERDNYYDTHCETNLLTKLYCRLMGEIADFFSERKFMNCYHNSDFQKKLNIVDEAFRPLDERGIMGNMYQTYFLVEHTCGCPPAWYYDIEMSNQRHLITEFRSKGALKRNRNSRFCSHAPGSQKNILGL